MSVQVVNRKALVCDSCGRELSEPPKQVFQEVVMGTLTITVRAVVQSEMDACEPCQKESFAEAARLVGARKPRGRAAHKGEQASQEAGASSQSGEGAADTKTLALAGLRPASAEEAKEVTG